MKPELIYTIDRYWVEFTGHHPYVHRVMRVDEVAHFVIVGLYEGHEPAEDYALSRALADRQPAGSDSPLHLTGEEQRRLCDRCGFALFEFRDPQPLTPNSSSFSNSNPQA